MERKLVKKAEHILKDIIDPHKATIRPGFLATIGLTTLSFAGTIFLTHLIKNFVDKVFEDKQKIKSNVEKYNKIKGTDEFNKKMKELLDHEDLLHIPEERRRKYVKHLTNSFVGVALSKPELIIQGVKMMHHTDGILPQDYLNLLSKEEDKFFK